MYQAGGGGDSTEVQLDHPSEDVGRNLMEGGEDRRYRPRTTSGFTISPPPGRETFAESSKRPG